MNQPWRRTILVCLTVSVGCFTSCQRAADTRSSGAASPPWFEEIAARAGIDFVHHSGHDRRHFLRQPLLEGLQQLRQRGLELARGAPERARDLMQLRR